MAMLGGAGGEGSATLWMAVRIRDRTGESLGRISGGLDRLGTMTARTMGKVGSLAMSFATLGRVTGILNDQQARAIGIFGTVIHIFSTGYYIAKTVAAMATWLHVHALTWEVSLMTLGIGVAIAAAAAIALLAMQTENAADSQAKYNVELEKSTDLEKRRTANQRLVRRGEYEEVIE